MSKTRIFWVGVLLIAISIPAGMALLSGETQGVAVISGIPIPLLFIAITAGVVGLGMVLTSVIRTVAPERDRQPASDKFATAAVIFFFLFWGAIFVIFAVDMLL